MNIWLIVGMAVCGFFLLFNFLAKSLMISILTILSGFYVLSMLPEPKVAVDYYPILGTYLVVFWAVGNALLRDERL